MHVLLAPNAFKGSLSAMQAVDAMAEGLEIAENTISYSRFPIADGGNDTMHLLTGGMKGQEITSSITNLLGQKAEAAYGWIEKSKTAVIGLSEVAGLHLAPKENRHILHLNTYGVGELIKAALNRGAGELLIALGGSATTDGGSGLLQALGLRYLDDEDKEITDLPYGLLRLKKMDDRFLDARLKQVKITVLCDVRNPLSGPKGAARIFAPQKGATKNEVALLEDILQIWSEKILEYTGKNVSSLPFSGAAGGAAAGLAGFTAANPVSGISYYLDVLQFDAIADKADYVLTGEGALDSQTLEGKGPFEVCRRAHKKNIPVIGFTGKPPEDAKILLPYFEEIIALSKVGENIEMVMRQGDGRLKKAVARWALNRFR